MLEVQMCEHPLVIPDFRFPVPNSSSRFRFGRLWYHVPCCSGCRNSIDSHCFCKLPQEGRAGNRCECACCVAGAQGDQRSPDVSFRSTNRLPCTSLRRPRRALVSSKALGSVKCLTLPSGNVKRSIIPRVSVKSRI